MRPADVGDETGARVRTIVRLALGATALVAAVALILLAEDVRRWPRALLAGDVRYAAAPFRPDAWRPPDRLPFAPARHLLGVEDDLAVRRAFKVFRETKPDNPDAFTMTPDQRAALLLRANRALQDVVRSDADPTRRGDALNLLALLSFQDPAPEEGGGFARSRRFFAAAVRTDGGNEAAKRNLELYLRLVPKDQKGSSGGRSRGRDVGDQGAGLAPAGTGY